MFGISNEKLTNAVEKNTEALGFKKSVIRGIAQAFGASLYLLIGAGLVTALLKAIGVL